MDMRRICVQKKRPNIRFEECLEQLYAEATDTLVRLKYETALSSLRKYPLPLKSAKECAILKGFGKSICRTLEIRLSGLSDLEGVPAAKRKKHTRNSAPSDDSEYVPEVGSCAHDILVRLRGHGSLTETVGYDERELVSDIGRDRDSVRSHLNDLLKKKLIKCDRVDQLLRLTARGETLALKLKRCDTSVIVKAIKEVDERNQIICLNDSDDENSTELKLTEPTNSNGFIDTDNQILCEELEINGNNSDDELPRVNLSQVSVEIPDDFVEEENVKNVYFPPSTFDVILLIDVHEATGVSKKPDSIIKELNVCGKDIMHELRSLQVGDFLWIARHRVTKEELVLPHIVERKRSDDLVKSIKDGRFHEQKFRLKQSGLSQIIYLVEQYRNTKYIKLPESTLRQAIINTRVHGDFTIQLTKSLSDSVRYLVTMTKMLSEYYKEKALRGSSRKEYSNRTTGKDVDSLMSFGVFNSSSSKTRNQTVSDMFVKQLLQLKGVSVEKVLAIADAYPTPKSLTTAYKNADPATGEKLLFDLSKTYKRCTVSRAVSKSIYQYFTSERLQ